MLNFLVCCYLVSAYAPYWQDHAGAPLQVIAETQRSNGQDRSVTNAQCRLSSCQQPDCAMQAYQLFKARASGADAVLLIAAVLPNKDLQYLMRSARKIGLQILLEVSLLCLLKWFVIKASTQLFAGCL